jgi:hypothetical protein
MNSNERKSELVLTLVAGIALTLAFATVISVLFGRTRWWVAVLYSVFFVEMGMMLLPPVAKMMGPFGISKYGTIWNGMFLTALLAHVAMGVVLGIPEQRWGRYPGLVFTEGRTQRAAVQA